MPSYEEVYEPPMLDETGQDVAAAIRELKSVVQPTNVCVDLDVSLEVSGWSNSAPYVYNWMNNKVTTECAVKVNYLEGAEDTDELYIGYEKIVGGIQFESPTKPTAAIPVRIHIVNAEADSITNIDDEMVSSNVISGASNVKQALTSLKNADASLSEQIESKIGNYKFINGGTNPSNWSNAFADTSNTIIMYGIAENQLPTGAPSGAYGYGTLIAITKSAQSGWEFSRNLIYIESEHDVEKKDVYFSTQGNSWYKISGTKVNSIA